MSLKDQWQRLTRRFRSGTSGSTESEAADDGQYDSLEAAMAAGPPGTGGLRAVTASLDQWFAREVDQLEGEARESGAEWAQAGLPRSDAPPEGELPPEQSLRRRASEIFTQWVQKVTTRVQDAIETNVQRTRQALNDLGFSLEEIRRARTETVQIDGRVEALEEKNRGRQSTFGFRSYWHWWWFVPAILLLVAVDWVANVPVFQELLPHDADISGRWEILSAQAELEGALAGLYRMWYRIALSPEVALLALGVIVFLVILAHIFGESVRRIVAVNERDVPEAGRSVRQYRRQFWIPAAVGLLGGIAVIVFLFMARQEIATFAETRLADVNQQIERLDQEVAAAREAGNVDAVAELSSERPALEDERATRQERVDYAERIRATNTPIAILNAVLFLTAALLGYLKVHDQVTAPDPQDPRLADLMHRKRELRALEERNRERARDADRDVREAIAWAEFLAQARPFEDWEGRRDRLGRVISMFRAENARIRGVDPQNIAGFRAENRFDVAVPEAHGRFRLPSDFGAVKERHLALLQEWDRLEGERELPERGTGSAQSSATGPRPQPGNGAGAAETGAVIPETGRDRDA